MAKTVLSGAEYAKLESHHHISIVWTCLLTSDDGLYAPGDSVVLFELEKTKPSKSPIEPFMKSNTEYYGIRYLTMKMDSAYYNTT